MKVTAPQAARPPITKPTAVSLALLFTLVSCNEDMYDEEEKKKEERREEKKKKRRKKKGPVKKVKWYYSHRSQLEVRVSFYWLAHSKCDRYR